MGLDFFELSGKTALITGASSGIGAYFAKVLARAGARVLLVARRKEKLEEVALNIQKEGGQAIVFPMDVSDLSSLEKGIHSLEEKNFKIDILINNAGIFHLTPLLLANPDTFDNIYKVNMRGPWYLMHLIARHMIKFNIVGTIINVASISGAQCSLRLTSAYSATKAGLIQMTQQLVEELAPHKIRINALVPGLIDTDMTHEHIQRKAEGIKGVVPLGRAGQVEDLEGAILFLASHKASSYMTGSCLVVDGGLSWRGIY